MGTGKIDRRSIESYRETPSGVFFVRIRSYQAFKGDNSTTDGNELLS